MSLRVKSVQGSVAVEGELLTEEQGSASVISRLRCLSSVVMLTTVCIGSGQTILLASGQPKVKAGSPVLLGITGLFVNRQIHSHE